MTSVRFMAAIAATLIIALLLGGCKDSAPSGPAANLGSTTVTKYVAIGNSITAGYQSGALYQSAQIYSYPNQLAQQLSLAGASIGKFEQPLYSDPGNADPATGKAARYELVSLAGPVIGPVGATPGSPVNLTLARPYDNLGIPGAITMDVVDTTGASMTPPRGNPMFSLILRNPALGKSILQQAVALHPDLVTFWLGNNEVLGYATSGGTTALFPTAMFGPVYAQVLGALRASLPNAKIVVANVPDVRSIPFFTTVGPKVAASLPAGVYLRYQKHGNSSFAMDSTRLTEANAPMLTLAGSSFASLLGRPTGLWYRVNHYPAIPAGIDTTKPFGLHPQNPWPDALVLDADEQATVGNAIAAENQVIAAQAQAQNAALVDINGFLAGIKNAPLLIAGQKYTADYISGGVFSLDGVHPSSRGGALIANKFIETMNAKFGMSVPYVDLGSIPGIPAPLQKGSDLPVVDPQLYQTMQQIFGQGW